jgi:hypothetical protein
MNRVRPPLLLVFLLALLAFACGGKGAAAPEAKADLDADPFALVPGTAIVVASVDAKAVLASGSLGAPVAALAEKLLPLGPEAGFDPKRDVDRIVLATFATTGADGAAIVSGRFDEAKITAVTKTKSGAPITKTPYAGRTTYAAGAGVYVVLTSKTLVAGTSDGVRRILDRIAAGKLDRAVPDWMLQTLQTSGASIAVAGDFTTQPLAAAAIGPFKVPWVDGLQKARVLADLQTPGLNVAATLTYADAGRASSAADAMRGATAWLKLLGPLLGGVSLQTFDVKTTGGDVQCKIAVDDATLGKLAALGAKALPESP